MSLFGTDGVRGPVGREPITPSTIMKIGWATGRVLSRTRKGTVLLGKDTRISGDLLETAMGTGLVAAGIDVALLGTIPTPGIAYLIRNAKACAGVMISASHNPYQDNGIKIFSADGAKLDDNLIAAIDATMQEEMGCVESAQLGQVKRLSVAQDRYVDYCKKTFPRSLNLAGLKVVLDCANGAAYAVGPRVFRELGADIRVMSVEPNGLNINDHCGSTDLAGIRSRVLQDQASVGIALDGDGDRVLLVDECGETVDGDQILYLLARHRQTNGNVGGGVVGTLMSNLGLEEALAQLKIPFRRTPVGDRHVQLMLSENNWLLGGETSGHVISLDRATTGDGIVVALEVLQWMQMSGKPLSELVSGMKVYPQQMINVPVEGTDAKELVSHVVVQSAVKTAEVELGHQGRVVLRPSGTEPLVRVMVEGIDAAQVNRLVGMIANAVEEARTLA